MDRSHSCQNLIIIDKGRAAVSWEKIRFSWYFVSEIWYEETSINKKFWVDLNENEKLESWHANGFLLVHDGIPWTSVDLMAEETKV